MKQTSFAYAIQNTEEAWIKDYVVYRTPIVEGDTILATHLNLSFVAVDTEFTEITEIEHQKTRRFFYEIWEKNVTGGTLQGLEGPQ